MFRLITTLAKSSSLSKVHPGEKIIICFFPIILNGFSTRLWLPLINACIFMGLHMLFHHKLRIVLKLTLGILFFSLISSVAFAFDYGMVYCISLILKSLSGGLAISFFVLTTPLDHLLYIGSKKKFLRDVCDIAKSMERFLILIEDEYTMLYKAAISRGGYGGLSSRIKSTGKISGLLFVNTMRRWHDIRDGIHSRCYRGYMPHLKPQFEFSKPRLVLICLYMFILFKMV